jgi:rod shape-determining protein MreD
VTLARNLTLGMLVVVALVLQVSVFSHASIDGVVPNFVLLVVVGAGLMQGAQSGAVLGFSAGLLVDLAPPADHVAGRWALALMLAGYVAGRVRQGQRPSWDTVALTVVACSFVSSSIFALSGVVLRDAAGSVSQMLRVTAWGMGWDLLLAVLVVPAVMLLLRRLTPGRMAW